MRAKKVEKKFQRHSTPNGVKPNINTHNNNGSLEPPSLNEKIKKFLETPPISDELEEEKKITKEFKLKKEVYYEMKKKFDCLNFKENKDHKSISF